ncbi:MAG: hypothetical protein ACRC1P_12055 [Cellulosilyticaceae bacterium]
MLNYFRFFIWLFRRRFIFFTYSKSKKALLLERKKLYFQAGLTYSKLENHQKALECFYLCQSYKHLMRTYEKLGLISDALLIAETYHYYKDGALISERSGNLLKAAYFYSYFNPLHAAKIYKKQRHFFEAGLCYLQKFQLTYAIDCFYKCSNPLHRIEGFKQVEELAVVFYLQKQYQEAFKLFIRMRDYHSALECARKLNHPTLIQNTLSLIDKELPLYASSPTQPIKYPLYPSLAENLKHLSA